MTDQTTKWSLVAEIAQELATSIYHHDDDRRDRKIQELLQALGDPEQLQAYRYALESWVVAAESLLGSVEMVHHHSSGTVQGFCHACIGMDRLRSAVATVKEYRS